MKNGDYSVPILLVDDSPDDRLFMKIAISRSRQLKIVGEACDGLDAIGYLLGNGCFVDRVKYPLPSLIILDLKMPRMTGFEVLEWIRQQYSRELPVVMVSGSWLQTDIDKSLELGATAYFKKTAIKAEQNQMMESMEDLLRVGDFSSPSVKATALRNSSV